MTYDELKGHMADFHAGEITKLELVAAIHIWQRGYTDAITISTQQPKIHIYWSETLNYYVTIPGGGEYVGQ